MRQGPATAVTVVALVLILASIASHGSPLWTAVRPGPADRLQVAKVLAALWVVGVVAAGAVTFVVHGAMLTRRASVPLRRRLLQALPIIAVGFAALSLLTIARMDLGQTGSRHDAAQISPESSSGRNGRPLTVVGWFNSLVRAGPGLPDAEETGQVGTSPNDGLPPVAIVLAAIAAAVAAGAGWWWHRRRRFAVPAQAAPDQEAVHASVERSIDAMLGDADPNTAIRGAYARLLEGLDACGTGRMEQEGPIEHLQRVLSVLRVRPEPLRELVGLFEVARFSKHPLHSQHRDQALRVLRVVADDLRGTRRIKATALSTRNVGAGP